MDSGQRDLPNKVAFTVGIGIGMDYIIGILRNICSAQTGTPAVKDDKAVAWGSISFYE
jgi:hypothetical protein